MGPPDPPRRSRLPRLLLLCALLLPWLPAPAAGQGMADFQYNVLQPATLQSGDYFGRSVAISQQAKFAIVGAPNGNANSSSGFTVANSGLAYIYARTGKTWSLVYVCQAGTPRRGSEFGRAVAVDAAGRYFVVGTLLGDSSDVAGSGSAYVFYRSTDAYGVDTYYQTPGVLQADNRGADDKFGSSVAISSAGDWIVIGAYACCHATASSTSALTGSAYAFQRSTDGRYAQFTLIQRLDPPASYTADLSYYGQVVDISSDGLLIGVGSWAKGYTAGSATVKYAGAVYIWSRASDLITSFSFEQLLTATTPQAISLFGSSLSVSSTRVAIGARNHNAGFNTLLAAGVVYIFDYDSTQVFGNRWFNNLSNPEFIRQDTPVTDAKFGNAVALSGQWLYVGVYDNTRTTASQVYVFQRSASSGRWGQVNYISDPSGSPANVGKFGYSLAVDGYYLLAGAPNDLGTRPDIEGYAVSSIPSAYRCSGYGAPINGVYGTCACDVGYFPSSTQTIIGQSLAYCSTCDTNNGYFASSTSPTEPNCAECSGHGTWTPGTGNSSFCVCNRGWTLIADPASGTLTCNTCQTGFSGSSCKATMVVGAVPLSGTFLQVAFTFQVAGMDVSSPPSPLPVFSWYWRKPGSSTPLANWQTFGTSSYISLTANTTVLAVAATYGLPVGTIQVKAVESWNGQTWQDVPPVSLSIAKSGDLSSLIPDLTGLQVTTNPATGQTQIQVLEVQLDTSSSAAIGVVLARYQSALDKLDALQEAGYTTAELQSARTALVTSMNQVLSALIAASNSQVCDWDATTFADYTALLSQVLTAGLVSNSGAPSALDMLMGLVGGVVNCTNYRQQLDIPQLEQVMDSLWSVLVSLSQAAANQTVTTANRREGDNALPQYAIGRLWSSLVGIARMNQTAAISYAWSGTKAAVEVQARRIVPTQSLVTMFLTDPQYGEGDFQLSVTSLPGFTRYYIDYVALLHPNPLLDSVAGGFLTRVSPVGVYGLYDRYSQPLSYPVGRTQLRYDNTHAPLTTDYCLVYVARQFNSTRWSTVAGCNGADCTVWNVSSASPVCPNQPQPIPTSATAVSNVAACVRSINPNVDPSVCFTTTPFVPLAVFANNSAYTSSGGGSTSTGGYQWDKGLILGVGYGVFYFLALLLTIWGFFRDRRLRRQLAAQPAAATAAKSRAHLLSRLAQHTWASIVLRRPGEPIATPQRVAILATAQTVTSCVMFVSMPFTGAARTVAALAPIAVFAPLVGWAPTTLLRWVFGASHPTGDAKRVRRYKPGDHRAGYFDKVQQEAENDPTKEVVLDEKGKLEAVKGGANPYLKILQQERLRHQNKQQASNPLNPQRNKRAEEAQPATNPLQGRRPQTIQLQDEDTEDDDDDRPVPPRSRPGSGNRSRPTTARSERSIVSETGLALNMQDMNASQQPAATTLDVSADFQTNAPPAPQKRTAAQFVVGRLVELGALALAIGLPFAGNAAWHWPLFWAATVVSFAGAGALYTHGQRIAAIVLLYGWSLGLTAWVLAGVYALAPLYYVIPLCLSIPALILAVVFVHRILRRPYNALVAYAALHAACITVALLIAVSVTSDATTRTQQLIGAVSVILAYPTVALLVVVRLRLRDKNRLMPAKVPRRARFLGFPLAVVVCLVSMAVVGWQAARKEVDFSSVWFLVVVLVGMAVDIAVWEPLRALLLTCWDALRPSLVRCGCSAALTKGCGLFSSAFLG
eukprot:EG_transcript_174